MRSTSSATAAGVELDRCRSEQLVGLGLGEAEVLGAHLEELAARTEPGERQRRIGARGDRQPRPEREALDEGRDEPMDGRLVDHVVVVEHEDTSPAGPFRERSRYGVEDAGKGELGVERAGTGRARRISSIRPARRPAAVAR